MTDPVPGAAVLLALAVAAGAAAWSYLRRERLGRAAWPLVACRVVALAGLGVLLLDVSCGVHPFASRPLVLLDGSLSLQAAGGQWSAARDSAVRWGTVRTFGDDRPGDTLSGRGASRLRPALVAAAASGRPVVVVSDGELDDAVDLPVDLLAGASVRIFPRRPVPDAGVTELAAPARSALDDTLDIDVTVGRWGTAPDSASVSLFTDRPLARRMVRFRGAATALVRFRVPARQVGEGEHLLRARISATVDSEARDDERWALLHVAATPGIVLVAAPPDWDGRQLYRTLRDVSDLPVRGFVRLGARWFTMDALAPVPVTTVTSAASRADLLVLEGAPGASFERIPARGLWRWPAGSSGSAPLPGDWYVSPGGPSPLSGAWAGTDPDSLPPLVEVSPLEPASGDWIGAVAQLGRRGAERPVVIGRERGGRRELLVAGGGFWRWAFSGGASEQVYRAWVASSASWLLGGTDPRLGEAQPVQPVATRGTPLSFAWIGAGVPSPLAVSWAGDSLHRTDTLRFDGARRAEVYLPVGVYRYQLADGGTGTVAVEPWSPEFVPRIPVLAAHAASSTWAPDARQAARDRLWLFALTLVAFAAEWALRRRRGLR
ncbi:MAG TPA: hypothetical protein VLC11_07540 [Gemmatimonadales bacterium]|nr:hypothetical protein [Gemmatimonadales bacterium]